MKNILIALLLCCSSLIVYPQASHMINGHTFLVKENKFFKDGREIKIDQVWHSGKQLKTDFDCMEYPCPFKVDSISFKKVHNWNNVLVIEGTTHCQFKITMYFVYVNPLDEPEEIGFSRVNFK